MVHVEHGFPTQARRIGTLGRSSAMLICHCHQVTDRTILRCAAEGARTVAQVGRLCGAGTGCGGCVAAVRDVLESAHRVLPVVARLPVPSLPVADPQLATG